MGPLHLTGLLDGNLKYEMCLAINKAFLSLCIDFSIIWCRIFPWMKPGQWFKYSFSSLFRQKFHIHLPKALNHFFGEVIAFVKLAVHGSQICSISSFSLGGEFHQAWLHLFHLTAIFNLADGCVLSSIVVKTIYMKIYCISPVYE